MKRFFAFLLLSIFFILPIAAEQTVFVVNVNQKGFTIDTEANTITHGGDVYVYSVDGKRVTFTYPNGYTYWWEWTTLANLQSNGGFGGWSMEISQEHYVDGGDLVQALEWVGEQRTSKSAVTKSPKNILYSLILIPIGILAVVKPTFNWWWKYGWMFKDAEPSDAYLVWMRIVGGIAVIAGIVLLFV